jgi:hypothetical protein
VPGTTRLLAAIVFVLAFPAVALADEGPTLLPGEGALVKRTHVTCTVTGTSVTCTKTGGLTATLVKGGKVHVTQGSRKLFAKRRQLPLGLDGGFSLAGAPIYCHVYAAPAPTITCSTIEPAGGLPRTYGFDMSDKSVVVFRYGMVHDRHDLRSFRQG